MPDFPNQNVLARIGRDTILTVPGALITTAAAERDGSDVNVLLAAAAAMADEVIGQLTDLEAALYLDSAEGADLDKLVFDRYQLVRKPAAAAQGTVQFTTSQTSPSPFTIPAGTQLNTTSGVAFSTVSAVVFPSGTTGPVSAIVRSQLAGADQQAAAGTISIINGVIVGAPQGLAVTNAQATFGAADVEGDNSLRARAQAFFTTARRGTIAAIQAGATAFPGVLTATAFEILDLFGNPAREVELVITDQFTESLVIYSTVPPTYQAQSASLASSVFAALIDVRAAGINVNILVASIVLQPIVLLLTYVAGADSDAVDQSAIAAAYGYVNSLPPGQALSVSDLGSAVRSTPGLQTTGKEILSPAGDVVPAAIQAIRTSLNLISVA